jgi:PHD/YefM family antitoxin component YafN of YafNO toxin-antitoxin module
MVISANEVKQRGVSVFDEILDKFSEVIINFRGKKKYVVLDYERYKEFREYELDKAYQDVIEDIANGDYVISSAKEHIERLKQELD